MNKYDDLFETTARIDGADFGSCPDGDLKIEWRSREEDHDQFRIQFTPVSGMWSYGWHQNRTHEELGPYHVPIIATKTDPGAVLLTSMKGFQWPSSKSV